MSERTTGEAGAGDERLRSELEDFLLVQQQRRQVFPRAALVGLVAGTIALLFRAAVGGAETLRNELVRWGEHTPVWGWLWPSAWGALGAFTAAVLTRYAPEAAGSGIPHLKAVFHRLRNLDWRRLIPVKFAGGALAIGAGLALGREGPTVQMGAAAGDAVSRWLRVSEQERLTLIAAGAGAGLAAAFNTPLAGLIFVLEEVRRDFQPIVFGAAFVASVVGDVVARAGFGPFPVFAVPAYPAPPLSALGIFAVLGIVAGLGGWFFNRGLLATLDRFDSLPRGWRVVAAALVGGSIGVLAWLWPDLPGSGQTLIERSLRGELLGSSIVALFFLRFLLTMLSYGTGVPGGIFAPLLLLGALLGLTVGHVAHRMVPFAAPIPALFGVVGMAAYFAAVVRAPLTGIVLIVEMTGNYDQILPLLVSCFFAYVVAEALRELPIYEALLERDLRSRGVALGATEPFVVEFLIEPGAPFVGQEVRSLGLPPGCILARCSDGKREWVPTATSRLRANTRLIAVVAPEAQHAVELLRKGCAAPARNRGLRDPKPSAPDCSSDPVS